MLTAVRKRVGVTLIIPITRGRARRPTSWVKRPARQQIPTAGEAPAYAQRHFELCFGRREP